MGELSAGCQALESACSASGNLATLGVLTDLDRRPPVPRRALSQEIRRTEPRDPFVLDPVELLICLRKARRQKRSSKQSVSALSKTDGGVRGIVVGDIIRRLVARTMSKQIAKKVEETTAPFQYALTSKAGCECVPHILQTLTDSNQETTIISIDGVGAYDLISRSAMLEGLLRMEDGDQILPFVRTFYGSPSTYLWEDEMGVVQHIPQGEGGEQADPSCPCSSHWASTRPSSRLRQG